MSLFARRPQYKWLLRADRAECGREHESDHLKIHSLPKNSPGDQVWLTDISSREVARLVEPVRREILDMEDVEGARIGTSIGYFSVLMQLVLWQYTTRDQLVGYERVWGLPAYLTVLPQFEETTFLLDQLNAERGASAHSPLDEQINTLKDDQCLLVYPAVTSAVDDLINRELHAIAQRDAATQGAQRAREHHEQTVAGIFSAETQRIHDVTQLLIAQQSRPV